MTELLLDRTSHKPLYQQLRDHWRTRIAEGRIAAGRKLPTIGQMMEKYSLAKATVQKAMDDLKAEGLVIGRRGEGLIVSRPARPAAAMSPELWVESAAWAGQDAERLLNKFHSEYPQVRVERRAIGNDVCWCPKIDLVPQYVDSLEDITDLVLQLYGRSGKSAELLKPLRVRGRLFTLPLAINVPVIACNVDVFERMDRSLPSPDWTLDDFFRTAKALTRESEGVFGFLNMRHVWDTLVPLVWQMGGAIYSEDGTRSLMDSPAAIEAARILRSWAPVSYPTDKPVSYDLFVVGKAAMMTCGTTGYYFLNESGCRWVARPLPQGRNRFVPIQAISYGIGRRARHRDAATAFLRECAQYELWPEMRARLSGLPLHKELERSGETERTYRESLAYCRPLLSDILPQYRKPVHDLVLDVVQAHYLKPLLIDPAPVEEILRRMADEMNYLVAQAGGELDMLKHRQARSPRRAGTTPVRVGQR